MGKTGDIAERLCLGYGVHPCAIKADNQAIFRRWSLDWFIRRFCRPLPVLGLYHVVFGHEEQIDSVLLKVKSSGGTDGTFSSRTRKWTVRGNGWMMDTSSKTDFPAVTIEDALNVAFVSGLGISNERSRGTEDRPTGIFIPS